MVAVRGASFTLELDALYAIDVCRVVFSIKEVGIRLAKDTSTLAGASAGAYRGRVAIVRTWVLGA
jgi:hypothetical protein